MLNHIFEKIQDYFGVSHPDPELELSARIFRFICLSIAFIFYFFAAHYALQGVPYIAALQFLVATVSLLAFAIYKKTNSTVIAGNFILVFGVVSAFLRAYMMGGISSPAFYIWPLIPVCTMALMPIFWSVFWSSLYVGIAVFFHVAEQWGYHFPSKIDPDGIAAVRIIAIIATQVLLLAIMYLFKKLNRQYRDLVRAKTEEKTNLVRIITHDIASPIMILNYHIKNLENRIGKQPELEKLKRAVFSIHSLSSEVKELEAIQSGKKNLFIRPVNLLKIIQEIICFLEIRFEEKSLSVEVSWPEDSQNLFVLADERALMNQIFGNVFTNAIKFTPCGGKIKIQIEKMGNQVCVKVCDSGIGIPKELIGKIFDPTKETTRHGTEGEIGTGFGMPILKSTIERFHGSIQIHSKSKEEHPEDHGTEVHLTFKIAG